MLSVCSGYTWLEDLVSKGGDVVTINVVINANGLMKNERLKAY